MFEAAAGLREEFAALEQQLADPAIHADIAASRRVGRRYAELTPIVKNLTAHEQLASDLSAARELAEEDPTFAEEAALRAANAKFARRFAHIEARLSEQGRSPEQSSLEEMDGLWNEAKRRERQT